MKKLILFGLCLFMFLITLYSASAFGFTDNLKVYIPFDEASGTNLDDSVDHVNNGTANGNCVVISGKIGNARNCSGSGAYITYFDTNNVFDFGSDNFTINYWGWESTANGGMFNRAGNSPTYQAFVTGLSAHTIYSSDDGASWNVISGASMGDFATGWHMFTFIKRGTNLSWYRDAVFVGSTTHSGTFQDISVAANTNCFNSVYGAGCGGASSLVRIDELGVWKNGTQFSDYNITQLYNNGTGCAYPFSGCTPAVPTTNFTITANEEYWNNSINTFSALIDGTTWYHTTTGLINTTLLKNDSSTHNITLNATGYFNSTYSSWNVTYDLVGNLTRNYTIMNISAFDLYNGNNPILNFTVTANDSQTVSTTTGSVLINFSWNQSIIITINSTGYFNYTPPAINTNQDFTPVNAYMVRNYTISNVTAWDVYNKLITHFTVTADSYNSSHSVSDTTTTGIISLNLLWNETYNISLDAINYSTYNAYQNLTTSVNFSLVNFTGIYRDNSVNISFVDEETNQTVNNVSLELISDVYSGNFSTTNGTFYIDLLSPEEYIIRYTSAGYTERFYIFNLQNRSYTALTLYLVNQSSASNVTALVYDESNDLLEDVYIKVLRYDVASNSYIVREVAKTNFEGQAQLHLVLNDEFYKFILEYPLGTVKKVTSPTYIYETTINFQINLGEPILDDYYNSQDVSYILDFNNATNNFRFTYSDANNVVSQACLNVYTLNNYEETLYNSTCVTGSSGSILSTIAHVNGTTYRADAYIYFDSEEYFLTSLYHTFEIENIAGGYGILLCIILMLTIIMIFHWSKALMLIVTPTPLLLFSALNIIDFSVGLALLIEIVCISIAVIIARRTWG